MFVDHQSFAVSQVGAFLLRAEKGPVFGIIGPPAEGSEAKKNPAEREPGRGFGVQIVLFGYRRLRRLPNRPRPMSPSAARANVLGSGMGLLAVPMITASIPVLPPAVLVAITKSTTWPGAIETLLTLYGVHAGLAWTALARLTTLTPLANTSRLRVPFAPVPASERRLPEMSINAPTLGPAVQRNTARLLLMLPPWTASSTLAVGVNSLVNSEFSDTAGSPWAQSTPSRYWLLLAEPLGARKGSSTRPVGPDTPTPVALY